MLKGNYFNHIKNLVLLANSDGDIKRSELRLILKIGADKGLTHEEISSVIRDTEEQRLIIPKSEDEKLEQLYDLILVMLCDNTVERSEKAFSIQTAEKYGFRKTVSALLVLYMIEGVQKKMSREETITFCKSILLAQ